MRSWRNSAAKEEWLIVFSWSKRSAATLTTITSLHWQRLRTDVLLTGDADLLVLGKHGRTRILNARAFVKEYL